MTATLDQINSLLTDVVARLEAQPTTLTEDNIRDLISSTIDTRMADPNDEFYRRLQFGGNRDVNLVGSKFARFGLTGADVEFLYDLQESLRGIGRPGGGTYPGPSEELQRSFRAVSEAYYLTDAEVRAIDHQAIDNAFPRIRKADIAAFQRAMDSAESGYGSQLIGAQYVADLWEAARPMARFDPLIPSFEMTAPTAYLPVEADIPEMLLVAESTANNSSNYGTVKTGSNRVQVDAKKFVIHQMWSGELEEDSIIPFVPFLRRQAALSVAFYSDSLVMNGDTTNAGTGNINLDDADPADTKHYLAHDGIRHAALVDNTANLDDVGAGLVAADIIGLKALMAQGSAYAPMHWGYPTDPNDLIIASDFSTYAKMLDLDEVTTLDKYGSQATILTGELGRLYGHPVIPSQVISLTEADGKVSTTANNNTKGQVVVFNRRGFVTGWRRRIRLETERIPATDQTRIVWSLRRGFGRFTPTGNVSGIEAAAVGYNITV